MALSGTWAIQRMGLKSLITMSLVCGLGFAARADDTGLALPRFALPPPASPAVAASPWSGFYVGTELFAVSGSGGLKGGVGGAADFGYNHEFSNNIVVGVGGAIGYAPSLWRNGPYSGFDIAETNLKFGYDMGRLLPYITTGVILEKPHTNLGAGYTGASDAVNGMFTGSSSLRAAGTVGAGFDYAITEKLTVGLEAGVTVGRNPGFFGQGPLGR